MPDSYFGTWEDLESDPERGRDEEWERAWEALDSEEEPPECAACDDALEGCSVCRMLPARPEGGERDG